MNVQNFLTDSATNEFSVASAIGQSREPACDTGLCHLWDYLVESQCFGDVSEYVNDTTLKKLKVAEFIQKFPEVSLLQNAMCSELFMSSYGKWLALECRTYTKDRKPLASGTATDLLSIAKTLCFHFFKEKAKVLFHAENASDAGNATWYKQLRSKVEDMCHRRDIKASGSLQEGIKKKSIGRYLVDRMAQTDLTINNRDSILAMVQRGTVFNNAGKNLIAYTLSTRRTMDTSGTLCTLYTLDGLGTLGTLGL